MGICNYYRKFVKDFAKLATPLNGLLKKGNEFTWDQSCQQAFEALRERLLTPPVLAYPDFNKPFLLFTDASDYAVGMVLAQVHDNKETVIAYGGRAMNKHERNYGITEKEALAVLQGIRQFDPYLRHSKFKIITDHSSLIWLFSHKQPTGRLARWIMALQQYDYTVEYRAGRAHNNADTVSRRSYDPTTETMETDNLPPFKNMMARVTTQPESRAQDEPTGRSLGRVYYTGAGTTLNLDQERLKQLQTEDSDCSLFLKYIKEREVPEDAQQLRRLKTEIADFAILDGLLYHFWYPKG